MAGADGGPGAGAHEPRGFCHISGVSEWTHGPPDFESLCPAACPVMTRHLCYTRFESLLGSPLSRASLEVPRSRRWQGRHHCHSLRVTEDFGVNWAPITGTCQTAFGLDFFKGRGLDSPAQLTPSVLLGKLRQLSSPPRPLNRRA